MTNRHTLANFISTSLVLGGCSSAPVITSSTDRPAILRFQNLVGLETGGSLCAIFDYGGLDRLCEYAEKNPADLSFQIGPAFTRILGAESNPNPAALLEERSLLWREWDRQGISFYAVTALDLTPSLAAFRAVTTTGSIRTLSSNLKDEQGNWLFEPSLAFSSGGKPIVFLNFSTAGSGPGWRADDVGRAFAEVTAKIHPPVAQYYVTGDLTKAERTRLDSVTDKPILFLGGSLGESNTTEVVRESKGRWFAKAPDLGRGVGELYLVPAATNSRAGFTAIGELAVDFKSRALTAKQSPSGRCARLISGDRAPVPCVQKLGGHPCPGGDR